MHFILIEVLRNVVGRLPRFFDTENREPIQFESKDNTLRSVDEKLNGIYTLVDAKILDKDIEKTMSGNPFRRTFEFLDGVATKDLSGEDIAYREGIPFFVEAVPTNIDASVSLNREIALRKVEQDGSNKTGRIFLYLGEKYNIDEQIDMKEGSVTISRIMNTVGLIYSLPLDEDDTYGDYWVDKEDEMIKFATTAKPNSTTSTYVKFLNIIDRSVENSRYILEIEYSFKNSFDNIDELSKNNPQVVFDNVQVKVGEA